MDVAQLSLRGREVLPALAELYPQLYLTPGEEGAELYKSVVLSGEDAPAHSLEHFLGSEEDSCLAEDTPAGKAAVITLRQRADFELFLQIMANRCQKVSIPRTQGAAILDGVINWTRIRSHKEEFLRADGPDADWGEEFRRFTSRGSNFKDALIVLSVGPYSAIPAKRAGFSEEDWLSASHIIRKTHECTHFLCRRLFPDKKDAVWDELVADAAGIYAALGRYDRTLAELFLGVDGKGYTGGRLENYVDGPEDRTERLDALAVKVHRTLCRFEGIIASLGEVSPYEAAIRLEEEIECWKQH